MEKFAGYERVFLFPPALEDWVGQDHPARFIREFVDALDLRKLKFSERTSEEGRPSYANDVLLKVWIFGYMNRIHSSRALEKACREQLSLLWLTGCQEPDHNTLWRFWNRNRAAIGGIFKQSVQVGYDIGCVGFVLHAVDGTKITSRASKRTALSQRQLEERLDKLEAEIEAMEQAIAAAEQDEAGEYRLPEQLSERRLLRAAIDQAIKELAERGATNYHPGEPEARMMKNHDVKEFAYNAQAVVDDQGGLIVGQDVVQDEFDQGQLIPMIERVEQTWERTAEETVADGGYNTQEAIRQAEAKGYGVTLAAGPADEESHPHEPFHPSKFYFDEEKNVVVCPRGQTLAFHHKKLRNGYTVDVYRGTTCSACPVRSSCTTSRLGRSIEISPYREVVLRQKNKRQTPEGRARIRRRMALSERPFAVIKNILGYRRARRAGLEKVKTEWSFVCAIYNLRVLMSHWLRARLVLG